MTFEIQDLAFCNIFVLTVLKLLFLYSFNNSSPILQQPCSVFFLFFMVFFFKHALHLSQGFPGRLRQEERAEDKVGRADGGEGGEGGAEAEGGAEGREELHNLRKYQF